MLKWFNKSKQADSVEVRSQMVETKKIMRVEMEKLKEAIRKKDEENALS